MSLFYRWTQRSLFLLILFYLPTSQNLQSETSFKETLREYYIDFETSLHHGFSKQEYAELLGKKKQRNYLPLLKQMYATSNFLTKPSDTPALKIPRIIHQIWLGGDLPKNLQPYQESWKRFHPTWEYKLWTDETIKEITLINQAAFDAADTYHKKGVILRLELLNQFGGMYVNTDVECFQSFELLHNYYEFYAGIADISRATLVNNALIGAIPHHPLIQACVKEIGANDFPKKLNYYGRYYFCDTLIDTCTNNPSINLDTIIILPPTYLYPAPIKKNNPSPYSNKIHSSFSMSYWHSNKRPNEKKLPTSQNQ